MQETFKVCLIIFLSAFVIVSCSKEQLSLNDVAGEEQTTDEGSPKLNSNLGTKFQLGDGSNLVMEHSWNTGGCAPCSTQEWSGDLDDIVGGSGPNESYFYENSASTQLNLKCQRQEGRRAEFKQTTEGPLTSTSQMDFWAVYFDIPNDGVTIAQVHNRGGSSNKPFFRLVLHEDHLETVVREDPEVDSDDTEFDKDQFYFPGGDYDYGSMRVILNKFNGRVRCRVYYNGSWILDETFTPQNGTDWIDDSGIANGYYLKAGVYNDEGSHTEDIRVKYTTFKFSTNDT